MATAGLHLPPPGMAATRMIATTRNSIDVDGRGEGPSSPRLSQPNILSRLQALFPGSPASSPTATAAATFTQPTPDSPNPSVQPALPPFLKVRLVTWNMHDSLPKGDLTDLLGAVPPYIPRKDLDDNPFQLPGMTAEDGHPYHLVIVAGQECPSALGIPMGFGAGFKLIDKERSRERELKRKKSEKNKSRDNLDAPPVDDFDMSPSETPLPETPLTASQSQPSSGWSHMLEDWYCHGVGSIPSSGARTASPIEETRGDPKTPRTPLQPEIYPKIGEELPTGPYELLTKERLMGIYLAVFIHRDLKHLVRGTSKAVVAAGLIGGRVGNKGGVGISVNIDGTRMLFMNAHLAAHEGRAQARLANFAKIRSELDVDDFLHEDDGSSSTSSSSGKEEEDVTDNFDFTCVLGDLNFRLDVTRLHADWLISRGEYAQAFEFDQLHNIMRDGEGFGGFREASINFPPTFKYDVAQRPKRHRSSKYLKHLKVHHVADLTEVEEKDSEPAEDGDADDDGYTHNEVDSTSLASTVYTPSRLTPDPDDEEPEEFYVNAKRFSSSPSLKRFSNSHTQKKEAIVQAVQKAKSKWIAVIQPKKHKLLRMKGIEATLGSPRDSNAGLGTPGDVPANTASCVELGQSGPNGSINGPPTAVVQRALSAATLNSPCSEKKLALSPDKKDGVDPDWKGRYDSSSKQRVPSWCDRILWKSTVYEEPEIHIEESQEFRGGFGRFAHMISQSIPFLRTRMMQPAQTPSSPTTGSFLPRVDSLETRSPTFTSFPERPLPPHPRPEPIRTGRALYHSKSTDHIKGVPINIHPPISPVTVDPQESSPSSSSRGRSYSLAHPARPVSMIANSSPATLKPDPIPEEPSNAEESLPPMVEGPNRKVNGAPRHRWGIFSFLSSSKDVAHSGDPESPRPRKGDVVCLAYHTLDDQAMQRLEGRSDHRPVIGSYAIYI